MLVSEKMFELNREIETLKEDIKTDQIKIKFYQKKLDELKKKKSDVNDDLKTPFLMLNNLSLPFGKSEMTIKKGLLYMKKDLNEKIKNIYLLKKEVETDMALKKVQLANKKEEYKKL